MDGKTTKWTVVAREMEKKKTIHYSSPEGCSPSCDFPWRGASAALSAKEVDSYSTH